MSDVLASLLEIAGLCAIVFAAFLVFAALGWLTTGVVLILLGLALDKRKPKSDA